MPEEESAKSFLSQIAYQFVEFEKVETNTILSKPVSMRYKGKGNIRKYSMEVSNLVTQLRALKLELFDDILVHSVLISLTAQFSGFKISYNTQKEKWTLIVQCVQEEERLKQEKIESAHLATTSHDNAATGKRKGIVTIKANELQIVRPHSLRCNRNKIRSSLISFARNVDM